MLDLLAQTQQVSPSLEPWAQLAATSVIIALFVWMVTKQWPQMLTDNRVENEKTRMHFEKILSQVEDNRRQAAKDGHDAAKAIASSLERQAEAIDNNSKALYELSLNVQRANQ